MPNNLLRITICLYRLDSQSSNFMLKRQKSPEQMKAFDARAAWVTCPDALPHLVSPEAWAVLWKLRPSLLVLGRC